MWPGTFSIVARDDGGRLGVAVATRVPAVGALCAWTRADVAAVASQAWTNPYLALRLFEAIAAGEPAPQALERVMAAEVEAELRQVGVVDAAGRAAAWTGSSCESHAGHRIGESYAVQGNMLAGPQVVDAMALAFEAGGELDSRLLAALAAGDAAGGDRRGRQSAALRVHAGEWYPEIDLRVDEHADPVAELRRIHAVARCELFPFVRALPTRDQPRGRFEAIREGMRPKD